MGQFGPIVVVGGPHSGSEVGDCSTGVRTGPLGSIERFGHNIVELLGLVGR